MPLRGGPPDYPFSPVTSNIAIAESYPKFTPCEMKAKLSLSDQLNCRFCWVVHCQPLSLMLQLLKYVIESEIKHMFVKK